MYNDITDKITNMNKQEIFDQHISERYAGIGNIISNDKYTEEDVRQFIRFQDSDKIYKGYENWLSFMSIADKIKRVGINGVLMREDVEGTFRAVEDDGKGHLIKYIVVKTKYGDIWVANGRQIAYMR